MTEPTFLESMCRGDARPAHLVQLYGADPHALVQNVGRYLEGGIRNGEALLVVATPEHRAAFEAALARADIDAAGQMCLFLDAQETVDAMLVDGQPDWYRFERRVGGALREMSSRAGGKGVRAYGEMVGLLWERAEQSAAVRLEHFWNGLLAREKVALFCAYPIDVFGREFQIDSMDAVLCAHTHLLPSASERDDFEAAIDRAMDEIFGARADRLRPLIKANYRPSWGEIPRGEAIALWLRNNLPGSADAVLTRARGYYRPCA